MTTDQPNPHDPLDLRIRRAVADAVADAPPAPELPPMGTAAALAEVRPLPVARRRGVVLAVLTAAAAVAVTAVVWPRNVDDRESIVGASTSAPGTSSGVGTQVWPDDVAVIVANEQGIFRVSSSGGELSTTTLLDANSATDWGHSVKRAFEFDDGSLLYQTEAGDILLQQPNLGTGLVSGPWFGRRLEDAGERPDGRIIYTWSQRRDDNQSQPLWFGVSDAEFNATIFEGPRGDQHLGQIDRLTFLSPEQFVAGEASDLLERGGGTVDIAGVSAPVVGADTATRLVGDGAYSIGLLAKDGTFSTTGRRVVGPVQVAPADAEVADLDLRGDALVVSVRGQRPMLHLLSSGAAFEVPVDGTATIWRLEPLGGGVLPEPTATTSTVAVTTPQPTVNPATGCMDFKSTSPVDAQAPEVGTYGFYSMEPIPSEPITIDGRPAVLQSWGGGLAALLSPPYWCSSLSFTLYPSADGSPVDKAAFVQWLAGLDITETLPAGMPPVVLAGRSGVAVFDANGTTTVTDTPAFRAVLLADGSVVWQELGDPTQPASGGTMHHWDPATRTDTDMWATVDWVATPILHDALPDGRLAFTVGDTLMLQDWPGSTSESVPLGIAPSGRLSVNLRDQLVAGEGLYATIDRSGTVLAPVLPGTGGCTSACAFEQNGTAAVLASATALRVVDRSTGNDLFMLPWGDGLVTDLDIRGTWVSYYAEPLGDSDFTVHMFDYTGPATYGIAFQGWSSAHFSRAPLPTP